MTQKMFFLVTFESLLGHFNWFGLLVALGGATYHNAFAVANVAFAGGSSTKARTLLNLLVACASWKVNTASRRATPCPLALAFSIVQKSLRSFLLVFVGSATSKNKFVGAQHFALCRVLGSKREKNNCTSHSGKCGELVLLCIIAVCPRDF